MAVLCPQYPHQPWISNTDVDTSFTAILQFMEFLAVLLRTTVTSAVTIQVMAMLTVMDPLITPDRYTDALFIAILLTVKHPYHPTSHTAMPSMAITVTAMIGDGILRHARHGDNCKEFCSSSGVLEEVDKGTLIYMTILPGDRILQ